MSILTVVTKSVESAGKTITVGENYNGTPLLRDEEISCGYNSSGAVSGATPPTSEVTTCFSSLIRASEGQKTFTCSTVSTLLLIYFFVEEVAEVTSK